MRIAARVSLAFVCSAIIAGLAGSVSAQDLAETAELVTFAPLDGQEFSAGILRQDDSSAPSEPLLDRLFFADGMFSSKICERYGFVPGAYWVRGTEDAIEFSAVLHSPTDGVMDWKGTVKDGKLVGTMRWTRERWYWTIEAEHQIFGELESQPSQPAGID
ncbi:MAG: hypothetical protein V4747_08955 [Pseudomonadota bacterium]